MSVPIAFGSTGHGVAARRGDTVLDLGRVARHLSSPHEAVLAGPTLDALLAAGRPTWDAVRESVEAWFDDAELVERFGHPIDEVDARLPFTVADYVDFFSSREHAENLGRILRPGQPALQPNWLSLPVGYHGRAGTVVASGTPVVRPSGQRPGGPLAAAGESSFGPSRKLDVEVEVGFVVGGSSALGSAVPTSAFEDAVFGVVLVNDWSARDIQAFEYVPLGPMLAKSFATSLSAWVYPLAALEAARVAPPARERPMHPYLQSDQEWGLDIELELAVNGTVVSRPRFREMYWTPDQQLAHLTVNGASIRPGDLFASGTVSSASPEGYGSLIELTRNGEQPVKISSGETRAFLLDGDEVVITATAPAPGGGRFSLGDVRGRIVPASAPHPTLQSKEEHS
ncbi:fumarylacetoacetate hydrolase family protein [Herbiconiux sp. CPCC 203407]|uniref:fumarylacetoacetase n=1 Tax=Herbiconiux oxytropis TaxID=2970915 RepID=A0AA42BX13_9MICO|nr:fumarylacetoacetate hydrolase family protein [Herbiconiux oxytropis]MCS5723228.1 fumarylacetoacetate hydrolase family protein [Herbiconiux oxytropis]MCS5727883.1 fumarylacetoacetate hydrolase family protein [Herbiconiux oxytropis]